MDRSTDRFLTTHTGSLPRPATVEATMVAEDTTPHEYQDVLAYYAASENKVVQHQLDLGLDIVTDGEQARQSYLGAVTTGWTGFGEESSPVKIGDLNEHPDAAAELAKDPGYTNFHRPACIGPITNPGEPTMTSAIEAMRKLLADAHGEPAGAVMTAPSPGALSMFYDNRHYRSHEDYLAALVEALRPEYRAIVAAGLTLQVDAPDLACAQVLCPNASEREAARLRDLHVEAINTALADIDAQAVRMHVCWGNYAGPHHRDPELVEIIDQLLRATPAGLLIEGANPRHAHEWRVFENVRLPEEKVLIPGVVDTTNNYIEHPDLVAERLERYADLVGRERVIAGTDCGFATLAGMRFTAPSIAWAKLESLVRGAELATIRCY